MRLQIYIHNRASVLAQTTCRGFSILSLSIYYLIQHQEKYSKDGARSKVTLLIEMFGNELEVETMGVADDIKIFARKR